MEIFDDFLHDDEISYLKEYVQEKSWRPQYSSPTNPYRLPFLKCFTPKEGKKQFISSFPNVDARFFFHTKLFSRIKKLIGEYTIDDVYLNGQYYGMDGCFHVDNCDRTVLIYVSDYHPEWGGFTQVGDDIVAPISKRMISFDGMVEHKAFAFSRQTCPIRITLAYKLTSK